MDYKVLTVQSELRCTAEHELEDNVKKHLSEGWKLHGGVSIAISKRGYAEFFTLAQAMVK